MQEPATKRKIALVVQRCGKEVNGGSETYALELAARLSAFYDMEILTTCAKDHITWNNHYKPGLDTIDGIKLRRFKSKKPRNMGAFIRLTHELSGGKAGDMRLENEWLDAQGPLCPNAIDYIRKHQNDYDAFIFMTYLFYLTVKGVQAVKRKALLIPTAHDEEFIRFQLFRDMFHSPGAIAFLSPEERDFVHGLFGNEAIVNDVAGKGMIRPERVDAEGFREKHALENYLVYVGRLETAKGCADMCSWFLRYKAAHPGNMKLVLMGKAVMDIPKSEDILPLGFVSEQEKYDGIAGASYLILPSQYESLSISVLEAMMLGTPVIVNGASAVLKGHCKRSNAGFYYRSYDEFAGILAYMERHKELYAPLSANARRYVSKNYNWDAVMDKYRRLIEAVSE